MKLAWATPADRRAQALAGVRAQRAALIAATDWTQLPDAPLTPAQLDAWRAYRQALRDVTRPLKADPTLDPDSLTWPTPPT